MYKITKVAQKKAKFEQAHWIIVTPILSVFILCHNGFINITSGIAPMTIVKSIFDTNFIDNRE